MYGQGWVYAVQALFLLNLVAYFALWVLTLLRLFRCRVQLIDDLTHHFYSAGSLR